MLVPKPHSSKSSSKVEQTGALYSCLNAFIHWHHRGAGLIFFIHLCHGSFGSSMHAAQCIQAKIKRARSLYLTRWLCQQLTFDPLTFLTLFPLPSEGTDTNANCHLLWDHFLVNKLHYIDTASMHFGAWIFRIIYKLEVLFTFCNSSKPSIDRLKMQWCLYLFGYQRCCNLLWTIPQSTWAIIISNYILS